MRKILIVFILGILLSGCGLTGEEIGRIEIDEISTEGNVEPASAEIELMSGESLNVWADMDIEYTGNAGLQYKLEMVRNGKSDGIITLDPFDKDITLNERKTTLMNKTKWKFSGRMKNFDVSDSGTYVFNAILVSNGNPSLVIHKADLVFKK